MEPEERIEVGFYKKPKEEELQKVSEIIGKTLKTLRVEDYDLKREIKDYFYYIFNLVMSERTNISPEATAIMYLPELRRNLKSTYNNIMHVGIVQEEMELLRATV